MKSEPIASPGRVLGDSLPTPSELSRAPWVFVIRRRIGRWVCAFTIALVAVLANVGNAAALPGPDADRDLIVDSEDNCPTIFNPTGAAAACGGTGVRIVHWAVDQFGLPVSAPGLCWSRSGAFSGRKCMFESPVNGMAYGQHSYLNVSIGQSATWVFDGVYDTSFGNPPENCAPPPARTVTVSTPNSPDFVPFLWVFTCPDADGDRIRDGLDVCPRQEDPPGATDRSACGSEKPKPEEECDGVELADVVGSIPAVARGKALSFPTPAAVCRAVWVPGLDGRNQFVPQGLVVTGRQALVSGYDGVHRGKDGYAKYDGPCRVIAVDLETGRTSGQAQFATSTTTRGGGVQGPPRCEHGGGIHLDRAGNLWLASTGVLYLLDRKRLFSGRTGDDAVLGWLVLDSAGGLKGSFLAPGPSNRLWLGTHENDTASRLYGFPTDVLFARAISPVMSDRILKAGTPRRIGRKAQGAASIGGQLYVSSSTSKCGVLVVGEAQRLGFGPGAEEIEPAGPNRVWVVHEAGSQVFPDAKASFPVIAEIDVKQLSPATGCGDAGKS